MMIQINYSKNPVPCLLSPLLSHTNVAAVDLTQMEILDPDANVRQEPVHSSHLSLGCMHVGLPLPSSNNYSATY